MDEAFELPLPELYLGYVKGAAEAAGLGGRLARKGGSHLQLGLQQLLGNRLLRIRGGRMVFFLEGLNQIDEEITFAQWMEDSSRGINLWTRVRKKGPGKPLI